MCISGMAKLALPERRRKKFWPCWHKPEIEGRGMANETVAPAAVQQDSRRETIAFLIGVAGWLVPGVGPALLKMWGRAGMCFFTVGVLGGLGAGMRGDVICLSGKDSFDTLGVFSDLGAAKFS